MEIKKYIDKSYAIYRICYKLKMIKLKRDREGKNMNKGFIKLKMKRKNIFS